MSIQKIARLAGVSVATVSRVLNNSESVKEKNRERVLKAIAEVNARGASIMANMAEGAMSAANGVAGAIFEEF